MHNQSIDKTVPPIKPLHDTWAGKKSAGSWCIDPPFDFTNLSIQSVNTWYINSTSGTLNAFADLARVWEVVFGPSNESSIKGQLGQDLFEQLLKKDQKVIHDVSRTLDLAGNDTAASNAIAIAILGMSTV